MWVLMLAWQVLYPPSCLPAPHMSMCGMCRVRGQVLWEQSAEKFETHFWLVCQEVLGPPEQTGGSSPPRHTGFKFIL